VSGKNPMDSEHVNTVRIFPNKKTKENRYISSNDIYLRMIARFGPESR